VLHLQEFLLIYEESISPINALSIPHISIKFHLLYKGNYGWRNQDSLSPGAIKVIYKIIISGAFFKAADPADSLCLCGIRPVRGGA